MDALVTTEWLAGELEANDLRIVDATLLDPSLGRDAAAEYEAAHIPGAVFMNLAELRDTDSDLPMMLPTAGEIRQPDAVAGAGRWQPHRPVRHLALAHRGARVADAAHVRRA